MQENIDITSFEELADRYAAELTAQFRTLSIFVNHAGEVGRTHEVFVSQILTRFLPAKLRIGTGFVLSQGGATRQQDIIVYDWQQLPLLLAIGDCVVVDADAVAATIEVKTKLSGKEDFLRAVQALNEVRLQHRGAVGLYAWEGLNLESALEQIWNLLRNRVPFELEPLPDLIFVRGKYLIVPNFDGCIETPPMKVMNLGEGNVPEGIGLLALLAQLWLGGIQSHADRPWWLQAWEARRSDFFKEVPWPPDLQERADAKVVQQRGAL